MKSNEQIIDDLIEREGGPKETNDSADKGGRTKYGISERANPEAWADGDVSLDEARTVYTRKYVVAPGFAQIMDPKVREAMVDFGVTSGPQLAIMKLQGLLKVEADGIMGPKTLAALELEEPRRLTNKIALERVKMAGRVVKKDPTQLKWLNGWLERFASFVD